MLRDLGAAPVTPKMRAMLALAGKVQQGGRAVTVDDVAATRREGATDAEVHDVVLLAAAFCMFNRYVDGLAAWTPDDPALYPRRGRMLNEVGYAQTIPRAR